MRSHEVTQGVARAPHRSLFYAMGYLPEDLEKPLIGVVCAHVIRLFLYYAMRRSST